MTSQRSIEPTELDELLTVLADRYCRGIIFYFRNTSEETATVADLTSEIETQESQEETAIQLRHRTLPRLESLGIIEHDPRSSAVRYQGPVEPQTLIEDIEVLYHTSET